MPKTVRQVEIPKPYGGVQKFGILAVIDRQVFHKELQLLRHFLLCEGIKFSALRFL